MKKNGKKKRVLYILALLLFAQIAVFSGYELFKIVSEYKKEEAASRQLQQYINLEATQYAQYTTEPSVYEPEPETQTGNETEQVAEEAAPTEAAAEETEPVCYPVVDFESLLSVNPDVVGWIYIPDTNINYPIVRGEDNRQYISTMVNGSYNAAGSIFMDYRNEPDFSDKHTVIYGHNMRNGSMFANIVNYKKEAYLKEHPMGMIMTPGGNFRFEVIGGYVARLSDSAWQLEFAGEDDFRLWLEEMMDHLDTASGIQPEETDRIITLSTCSYEFSEARYVLVCRVIE